MIDCLTDWSERTELPLKPLLRWASVLRSKFYNWRARYGKANEHNGKVPRDHWLEPWEREAIVDYHDRNSLEGYRRLNVTGTFYYFCTVLDGYSRFIVHWEIRPAMTEADVELVIQRAREAFPDVSPHIISDNGPQFIANEFKKFVRLTGMTHVRTSLYDPQSNGKIERWHKTLKTTTIRP